MMQKELESDKKLNPIWEEHLESLDDESQDR